jgi:hypothetical protein
MINSAKSRDPNRHPPALWVPDSRCAASGMTRERTRRDAYTVSGSLRFSGTTPSFFCRLVDDVVYWNSSFFSG